MPSTSDSQLLLDYIGRLHAALMETGKSSNNTTLALLLVSLGTVSLSVNLIEVSSEFSILGLELKVSLSLLLIALACAIWFLHAHMLGLWQHAGDLLETMLRLYRDLGLADASLEDLEASPLEPPHFLTVISKSSRPSPLKLGRVADSATRATLFGVVFLAPLLAQGLATWKIVTLLGPRWWALGLCIVLIMFTAMQTVSRISSS